MKKGKQGEVETFEVKSHYSCNTEVKRVRYMALDEAKALREGEHVLVLSNKGNWANAKVNGRPKVWKTRPLNCTVPLKYGVYKYFTEEFTEARTETNLVVEVEG